MTVKKQQEAVAKAAGLDLDKLKELDFNQLRDLLLLILGTLRSTSKAQVRQAAQAPDDPAQAQRKKYRAALHRILEEQSEALSEVSYALTELDE